MEQIMTEDADAYQDTFARWLKEYRGIMMKIVRLYSFSAADAEDLYQEISIALWHSVRNFKGNAKESTWVYRVSLYTAIASLRKDKKQAPISDVESLEGFSYPDDSEQQGQLEQLYNMLSKLDPIQRSLMLLALEGCSYEEIADVMGITVSNVGVKLNRIKKRLNEWVTEE